MPANAPATNRLGVSNSFVPCRVSRCMWSSQRPSTITIRCTSKIRLLHLESPLTFFNSSYVVNWTALQHNVISQSYPSILSKPKNQTSVARKGSKGSVTHHTPVRHNPQTVNPVPSHKPTKPLLSPHPHKATPHTVVRCIRTTGLYLPGTTISVTIRSRPQIASTYRIIFNLSSGLTTVLEAAPAHPPAKPEGTHVVLYLG